MRPYRRPAGCGWATSARYGSEPGVGDVRYLRGRAIRRLIREVIDQVTRFMDGHTICALSDAAACGSGWFLRRFRQEFEDHVTHAGCPLAGTSFEI